MKRAAISRRAFLRGAGVSLALPALDAMLPVGRSVWKPERRIVAIGNSLGLLGEHFTPAKAARDYQPPAYLQLLADFRDDFTVFSGVSHPGVDGGHKSGACFLTGARHPAATHFRNTVSMDQLAAEKIGAETRFACLTLATDAGSSLSCSRDGTLIPATYSPAKVFAQLFLAGTPEQTRERKRALRDGRSILDTVLDDARRMQRDLGTNDRATLEDYLAAVRAAEEQVAKRELWADRPKPEVAGPPVRDHDNRADVIARVRLMYDLIHLALKTDSTRLITMRISLTNLVPVVKGVRLGYHDLGHHGRDPKKLSQLRRVETEEIRAFRDLLAALRATPDGDGTLLDHTMVLMGSNLGNSSSHDTKNLPMLLAGGGFTHGQHLAFDRAANLPVANIFVSMLQRLGLAVDSFASSTGPVAGL